MNNYKCLDAKNYNLTEEKEYTPTEVTETHIHLINDKNVSAKYSIDLFEEVEVVPPELTEDEVIITIEYDNGNITFTDRDHEEVEIDISLHQRDTHISCGIRQIYGIASLMGEIEDFVECGHNETRLELKKALLKKAIEGFIDDMPDHAISIMSTNVEDGDGEDYNEELCNYLTEISHFNTRRVNNPNSGNEIMMWGFYKEDIV